MFFKGGERLIIRGENIHRDYQRYNEIVRGLSASKVGEIAVENVYGRSEFLGYAAPKNIELSVWRVTDKNVSAWDRGVDRSRFVIEKPNGDRVSYVLVPRMNTDSSDPNPCEYTDAKDATFEDINDPRTIVIARSYKGMVSEIAKDFVRVNEAPIRENYKFLTDNVQGRYCDFENPLFLRTLTEQAVQMFEPNVYQSFMEAEQKQSQQAVAGPVSFFKFQDPITQMLGGREYAMGVSPAYREGEGTYNYLEERFDRQDALPAFDTEPATEEDDFELPQVVTEPELDETPRGEEESISFTLADNSQAIIHTVLKEPAFVVAQPIDEAVQ